MRSLAYRGRLTGPIVQIIKTYDDFREVRDGQVMITLPFASFTGEAGQEPGPRSTLARAAVNAEPARGLFEPKP